MFIEPWTMLILLAGVVMVAVMMSIADRDGVVSKPPEHPGFAPPRRRQDV